MTEATPVVILCGGKGTRISEVSSVMPKPLLGIGPRPILWHIMSIYARHGVLDFHLALGWLGDEIRRWVLQSHALLSDFTVELGRPEAIEYHGERPEAGWRISCVDTGVEALTGTRVRRIAERLPDGPVCVTYGDCVGDVDITNLLAFHRAHGRLATVTAVRPPGRFGELVIDEDAVQEFAEKPQTSAGSINGGFMVFEREALLRYVPDDDDVMLEREPMSALAAAGELRAWPHDGFWQPMDTPRERDLLNELWERGEAPWLPPTEVADP